MFAAPKCVYEVCVRARWETNFHKVIAASPLGEENSFIVDSLPLREALWMARFVILEHDFPTLHWDFMLEVSGMLRTWRLPQPPAAGIEMVAEALGDHRLAYLDYEGPVSNSRGNVKRWDRGEYAAIDEPDARRWRVQFAGERLA